MENAHPPHTLIPFYPFLPPYQYFIPDLMRKEPLWQTCPPCSDHKLVEPVQATKQIPKENTQS